MQPDQPHLAQRIRCPLELLQRLEHARTVVAHRQHVAAGRQRRRSPLVDPAGEGRAAHAEIVGEHGPGEAEIPAQFLLDPALGETRRRIVHLGEQHVRDHHRRQAVRDQSPVRQQLAVQRLERAAIHRQRLVRVGDHGPVAREVLRGRGHPRRAHALHAGQRQRRDDLGIAMVSAIPDDLADAVVEIHTGRETQVDAGGAQLRCEQPAALPGKAAPGLRIQIVGVADRALRWQRGEGLAEALDAAALVIHRHEQRGTADRADLRDQRLELRRALVVAAEQDHRADQRMRQHATVLVGEARARHVDHQRSQRHGPGSPSLPADQPAQGCRAR